MLDTVGIKELDFETTQRKERESQQNTGRLDKEETPSLAQTIDKDHGLMNNAQVIKEEKTINMSLT